MFYQTCEIARRFFTFGLQSLGVVAQKGGELQGRPHWVICGKNVGLSRALLGFEKIPIAKPGKIKNLKIFGSPGG